MIDTIAFLRGLRQVRHFSPRPVPQDALNDILEVARWTGSARNLQPWDLLVIQNRSTLQTLAHIEGSHALHLAGAGAGIALVMSGDLENPDFDTYDEGRLSERIMLAATADGLGSAIGWFRGGASDEAKRILDIPAHRLLRTIMSIGFADMEGHNQRARPPQPRRPLSDIVHHEKFS